MLSCHICNIELSEENWYPSLQKTKSKYYICKICFKKKCPDNVYRKGAKTYMREYMRGYRQRNLKRIREIARLAYHRRHREFTTDIILNNHFEGAELHHITPSTAIYIPKKLHKSIFHNLSIGLNMNKINNEAKDWFRQKV